MFSPQGFNCSQPGVTKSSTRWMKEGWVKSSSNNCDPFLIACVSIFLSVATEFFPTNRITFLDANTIVKSDFPYQFDLLSFSSQGNGFDIDHVSCQQRAHHVSSFVRKKIILCLSNKLLKSQFLSSKPLIWNILKPSLRKIKFCIYTQCRVYLL